MAYPTALSQYGQECVDEELTIEKRASKLMKDLNQLDLSKPTIFVGHSMGGLLIKSIITQGKCSIGILARAMLTRHKNFFKLFSRGWLFFQRE